MLLPAANSREAPGRLAAGPSAGQSLTEPRHRCPHRAPHKLTAQGRTAHGSGTFFFFSGLCEVTAALPEPRARRRVPLDLAALCAAPHGRARQPERPVAAQYLAPLGSGVKGGGSAGTIRCVAAPSHPAPPARGLFP